MGCFSSKIIQAQEATEAINLKFGMFYFEVL